MHVDASAHLEQQTQVVSPLWHHVISMGSSEATEHCPDMQALGSEGSWLLEMPRLDHTGLISS